MSDQHRILIVEDDESIRNLTRMHLKMHSFDEVYSVSDGESALLLAPKIKPDVVLLDLMLPGIDGLEVLRSMRNEPMLQNTAIIIITAKGEDEDIVTGLENGADDYLAKPFSSDVLLARIKVQLRRLDSSVNQAIVTLGGVDLNEIDPATMESKIVPGLYFAGEVMDIDGPTGGYNLTMAFATARKAAVAIAAKR